MKKWLLVLGITAFATVGVARADDKIGIVLMHGKLAPPLGHGSFTSGKQPAATKLIADLKDAGYLVATPEMCWSERRAYDKTYDDCRAEIDATVADLKQHGATRIVVAGQSLGGNAALAYGATHEGLLGIIAYAPADDPKAKAARPGIPEVIAKAQQLVAQGKADDRTRFDDLDAGPQGIYKMQLNTTARIYLSFYAPESSGVMAANTRRLKAPVLWISGDSDPTQSHADELFGMAPPDPMNRHVTVKASHTETPNSGRQATIAWLAELAKAQ